MIVFLILAITIKSGETQSNQDLYDDIYDFMNLFLDYYGPLTFNDYQR